MNAFSKIHSELQGLIEAHKASSETFSAACGPNSDAMSACWGISVLAPSRIVDGRAIAWWEVHGVDPAADMQGIIDNHDKWHQALRVDHIKALDLKAGRSLEKIIETSKRKCLDIYGGEIADKLVELLAPYKPAIDAYKDAYDAEQAAAFALLQYQPKNFAELSALARYIRSSEIIMADVMSADDGRSGYEVFADTLGSLA